MKTDNSHKIEKILLRIEALSLLSKKEVRVLDCYAGRGVMWTEVAKRTDKNLKVLQIEKEKGKNRNAICGDNLKVLQAIDLSKYDIIDLDSYGIPDKQLQILFDKNYHGVVIVTAIQSMLGLMPKKILLSNGFTEKMIKKCPTIFSSKGFDYLKNYLYLYDCKQVTGYFIDRKNYFYFTI